MIIAVNFPIEAMKKIRASTGFEPATSALPLFGKFTAMIILYFHLQLQFKNELFHILHIITLMLSGLYFQKIC